MMCNLNFIYRKDNKAKSDVSHCMNAMSLLSWSQNKDGEGYYGENNKTVFISKSKNKIIYRDKYNLLLTHQRLATSGKSDMEGNAHPHETTDLIVFHNGIFWDLGCDDKSDTNIYAGMLQDNYTSQNGDLLKAVNKTHKKAKGSYSVFIVEKSTGKLYYYKNDMTNISLLEGRNYIVMSTIKQNVVFAKKYLKIKGEITSVKNKVLVDIKGGFVIAGKIKAKDFYGYSKKRYTYNNLNDYGFGGYDYGSGYGRIHRQPQSRVGDWKEGMYWDEKEERMRSFEKE